MSRHAQSDLKLYFKDVTYSHVFLLISFITTVIIINIIFIGVVIIVIVFYLSFGQNTYK